MRWTQTLIPTSKDVPADAQIVSHQLMLRAGLMRQVAAGMYTLLPAGLRSLHKATALVRRELDVMGCAEIALPASPTPHTAITEVVGAYARSYKQFPLGLYQVQRETRHEDRPRWGLLRPREVLMMRSYGFHATSQSLDEWYGRYQAAFERMLTRCGIRYVAVEAEAGQQLVAVCEAGDDVILTSDKTNYTASLEKCATGHRPHELGGPPRGDLERVHTPGMQSITDVAAFLKLPPSQVLKTLVYQAEANAAASYAPKWIVAVVRGDHDVNEAKLAQVARERFNVQAIRLEDSPELRERFAIGFVGPDEAMRQFFAVLVIDPDAAQDQAWVAGGNAVDYHVRNFNWFRDAGDRLADPTKTLVADIRDALDGDPSPMNDGGILRSSRGIAIGRISRLGTRYSAALGAQFLDDQGQSHPIIMGACEMEMGRLLVAAIETSHDEHGIIWPTALAPWSVVITPVRYEGQNKEVADRLHDELTAAGVDTLLDDRDLRPGPKFADADLIGIPIRLNIGERGLKESSVELKLRREPALRMIKLEQVVQTVKEFLA